MTVSETKDARYNGSLPTPVAACMHDDDDGDDAAYEAPDGDWAL